MSDVWYTSISHTSLANLTVSCLDHSLQNWHFYLWQIVKLIEMKSLRCWIRFTRLSQVIRKNLQTWPLNQILEESWCKSGLLSEFEDKWWRSLILQPGRSPSISNFQTEADTEIIRNWVTGVCSAEMSPSPVRNSRAHSSDPAREGDSGGQLKAANYQPAIFLLMQLC